MQKYIILIPFLCVATTIYGQNTSLLQGKIIKEATSSPVANATVLLKAKNIQTVSAADGSFRLDITDANDDTLMISCIGFFNVSIAVTIQASRVAGSSDRCFQENR